MLTLDCSSILDKIGELRRNYVRSKQLCHTVYKKMYVTRTLFYYNGNIFPARNWAARNFLSMGKLWSVM